MHKILSEMTLVGAALLVQAMGPCADGMFHDDLSI